MFKRWLNLPNQPADPIAHLRTCSSQITVAPELPNQRRRLSEAERRFVYPVPASAAWVVVLSGVSAHGREVYCPPGGIR